MAQDDLHSRTVSRERTRQEYIDACGLCCPLLQQLVNAGLMAFRRCEVEAAAREGENESRIDMET
jgi:hypothetical protein